MKYIQAIFNNKYELTNHLLLKIKRKAIRLKAWYKLNNIERAIIDLTIKCVNKVKSIKLKNIILKILNKIKEAIENDFLNKIYENGLKEIIKIIKIAYSWGNKNSLEWIKDKNFIFYLGIKNIYTPNIWKI
jgi:benzoyl-CoA reductase/2-hydroxyglutaryl-CoA dehydratase subunit BcrC/BadD/HgdB